MATYSVSSGRLVCTGTDITTQGICNAVNANSGTLTPIKGSPASATFYSSDTGYVSAIIRAEITIGDNSSASTWVIESQNVIIEADIFLQNKGDLRLGQKRANGTLSFNSRFVFDSTNNGADAASWERWRLQNGSWLRGYNSVIHSDSLLTTMPSFGGIELEGCYVSVLDGIGEGGTYANTTYSGQTITYKNCVFDAHVGVGIKLYMINVNFVLQNNAVTNNVYGIQPGGSALVLIDFRLDTNTFHSVPNVGNADVTFINPDFQTIRLSGGAAADVHRIAYRYNYTARNTAGAALSGVKVRIFDQQNTAIVNNLLTNAAGNVPIPTYSSIPVLLHSTWANTVATARANHAFGSISYLHNIVAKTISATADITDTIIYVDDTSITQTTKATVDAYTAIDTSAKLYDRAKSWLFDNYAGQTATLVSRSGTLINAGSYNVTIDATAAQAFAIAGNTLTIKASTYTGDMTTTGVITLANGATFVGTRTDANGTVVPPKTVSVTGLTAGSRLRVYNTTTATEVVNQIVAGTSYNATYNEGTGYTTGNTLTITATWQSGASAKLPFSTQVVVGSTGWSALVTQQDDTVYSAIAVDGSTVTEFTADYPNVQVDISDPNGQTSIDRLYAWFVHTTTTESGIRNWFGGIVAEDAANFRVVTSTLNLKLDNLSATGVEFTGGLRLYRDDNASPLVASTTGGGSITMFAGKVYTSVVSTASPVITGDISQVPAAVQTGMTAQGYTTTRAAKLDNADVATSTRLASASYTTPPTVSAIRTELDTNSTKLDVAVGTRLAAASYTPPPTAAANATAVRSELTTELGRIDATVSSRLASASYTSPDNASITAIKAKTDNLPPDPADESSIQAAIAAIPAAPSASSVANAVRTELTTELGRIDVATSTRLASASYSAPPTPAANATAVRIELNTELSRIDVATSTRLATAGYTAPANADISAIKAKTDNLPVDPASTTNITNSEAILKKKILQAALL